MEKSNYRIAFLGGSFCGAVSDFVLNNSKGVVQNAANVLQQQIVNGLLCHDRVNLLQISLPFVGSYPKRFSRAVFPKFTPVIDGKYRLLFYSFINLSGVKLLSRFFSALLALFKNSDFLSGGYLIVYSAHIPFVLSAVFCKLFCSSIKLIVIVPDLPEYMGGSGFAYAVLKKLDSIVFRYLLRFFDWYVVLTKPMADVLGLDSNRVVVVEGVVDDSLGERETYCEAVSDIIPSKYLLYSGTLDPRYGIEHLLESFLTTVNDHDLSLVICGAGSGCGVVESYALNNPRIRYLGQLPRSDVVSLQKSAFALINPRLPEGIYTNYSFPSKIMEYFSSGRPVIMYKLGGIPDDYDGLYFSPSDDTRQELSRCIIRVSQIPSDELSRFGMMARDYVFSNKSPAVQVGKILSLIGVK